MLKLHATVRTLLLASSVFALALPVQPTQASPLDWISGSKSTAGNGSVTQQTRNPGHFDGVSLGMAGDVELRLGDTESITVTTDDNLQPLVDTYVEDGTLKIRVKKGNRIAPTKLHFVVQARSVSHLTVGGSGTISADGLRSSSLNAEVGGSGSINVRRLDSDNVRVQIGGSGNFTATGRAAQVRSSIGGSGSVDVGQLSADTVHVSIGGSGQAVVWARRELGVSVGGSGDVQYYGDPQVSKSIAGSGTVKRLGTTPL